MQFVPKRSGPEDLPHHDRVGGGAGDYGEGPPPKQAKQNEGLTKFSVEIVQQLEFTTSANNSQISTNVTVKALNTSVKSDLATTVSPQPSTPRADVVECKQEQEDNPEFVDLEQCAAALEKDAATNGGSSFPGFSDLIGDETSDDIITSDAFKDLISEISDFHPAFLKELDFDSGDSKNHILSDNQPQQNQQQQQHVFKTEEDTKINLQSTQRVNVQGMQQQRMYSSNMDFSKAELSPAAQTLKQMAEQHQHKTQLGMNFNPASRSGKPYGEFQYNGTDFIGSPQSNSGSSQQYKPMVSQSPKSNFVSSENIKQEVFSAQNSPGVYSPGSGKGNQTPTGQPRLSSGFKQQYSPYSSPGAHGSPQYTPRGPGQGPPPPQAPPRPPSCPSSTTLQINQAQQLHISQSQGQQIQVSLSYFLFLGL
ncbi:hypothetical protein J6590_030999 [Homalodisca vitripennis]|nr:hypothetical protein J6590_030999 [Homalodisca vitripennis]